MKEEEKEQNQENTKNPTINLLPNPLDDMSIEDLKKHITFLSIQNVELITAFMSFSDSVASNLNKFLKVAKAPVSVEFKWKTETNEDWAFYVEERFGLLNPKK